MLLMKVKRCGVSGGEQITAYRSALTTQNKILKASGKRVEVKIIQTGFDHFDFWVVAPMAVSS
jgi:hypothetical protein